MDIMEIMNGEKAYDEVSRQVENKLVDTKYDPQKATDWVWSRIATPYSDHPAEERVEIDLSAVEDYLDDYLLAVEDCKSAHPAGKKL